MRSSVCVYVYVYVVQVGARACLCRPSYRDRLVQFSFEGHFSEDDHRLEADDVFVQRFVLVSCQLTGTVLAGCTS